MLQKVLLADESKPSLILISEVLKDLFAELVVRVAKQPSELDGIYNHTTDIDLLIMDVSFNGDKTTQVVKTLKKERSIPIFLTAYKASPQLIEKLKKELAAFPECVSFLEKPVEHDHLLQHMEIYTPHLLPMEIPALATAASQDVPADGVKVKKKAAIDQYKKHDIAKDNTAVLNQTRSGFQSLGKRI